MNRTGLYVRIGIVGVFLAVVYGGVVVIGSGLLEIYGVLIGLGGSGIMDNMLLLTVLGSVVILGYYYLNSTEFVSPGWREVEEADAPELHAMLDRVSEDMDIEKPRLGVAEMGSPNAYAVGRRGNGTVTVSEELLQLLSQEELEAVVAHECAHLKNQDSLVMTVALVIRRLTAVVAVGLLFTVFAVILLILMLLSEDNIGGEVLEIGFLIGAKIASLVLLLVGLFHATLSRYREYIADADAVRTTADKNAMISALEKIERAPAEDSQFGNREVQALCIYGDERGLLSRLFSTHPPLEKRIERLQSIS